MSDAGHPQRHGFVQCERCRTWIVSSEVVDDRCKDILWCVERRHDALNALSREELLALLLK